MSKPIRTAIEQKPLYWQGTHKVLVLHQGDGIKAQHSITEVDAETIRQQYEAIDAWHSR